MASIEQRSGRWRVRVVGRTGKRLSRTFATKTAAKAWARETEADAARGRRIDVRAGDRRFDVYAESWLEERKVRLAPGSWKRDESYLRSLILPHFGGYPVRAILPSDLSSWVVQLHRADGSPAKESTKATALQIVRSVLERARRDGAIPTNPVDDVQHRPKPRKTKRIGRALNDSELSRVVDAAYVTNEASAFIVVALARLGLRIGEALGLQRIDFDLEAGLVSIRRSRDRDGSLRPLKGRLADDLRTVPLPGDVADAYSRHIALQGATPLSGDLFLTGRNTPLTYANWRRRHWVPTVKLADVGHVVPHDLRHTCITRLFLVDRWTPAEVQSFVGHTDARVTLEIYSHVNPSDLPRPSELKWTTSGPNGGFGA